MAWFDKLKSTILGLNFTASKCDPSLFIMHTLIQCNSVLMYVGAIIITGSSRVFIQQLITKLNLSFSLRGLGKIDYFLGIEVHPLPNGSLLLSQRKYAKDLLLKANMASVNSMASPMAYSTKLSKVGSARVEDLTTFRSIVRALQYATITRP